ncbi:hypothetical protein DHD05_18280 [Arenibacter sp. N53]|nr:hypothetical protein [Arenibacter sp. N53]
MEAGPNANNAIPFGRTPFPISYWREARFLAAREGQAERKVEIGDGVQDFCREALCPEWSATQ